MIGAISLALLVLAAPASGTAFGTASADELAAAKALIARVVPGSAASFIVQRIPAADGRDVFEIESRGGRIVLRGSSGVAIASALNRYLEEVAVVTVSNPLRPIHG